MRSRRAPAFILALAFLSLPAPSEAEPHSGPIIAGCPVFPRDNIWNARADDLPVDRRSDQYVASIGADASLKPDFGAGLSEGRPMGMPWVSVSPDQPDVPIHFAPFGDETDAAGP
jgi:hypothetical protein